MKTSRQKYFVYSTALFLLVMAVTILLSTLEISDIYAQPLAAQIMNITGSNSTLYVSGMATDRIEPDRVSISIGVETTNDTAEEALLANTHSMNKILTSLRDLGVKENETSTSQFSIRPNYNYSEDGTVLDIIGFTATNSLDIQSSKLQNVSSLIDVSVTSGANNINNIAFFVSNNKLENVKNTLIENAIANARQKADIVSSSTGLQIVGIKSIFVDSPGIIPPPEQPYFELSAERLDMAQQQTPILSGEQEISVKVDIVFLIGK